MRENCLSGSEGGGAANPALPTPIQGGLRPQVSKLWSLGFARRYVCGTFQDRNAN